MTNPPVRTLLVDDSAVTRGLLARALATEPAIEVSGTAMHGRAAISWMQRHPVDVVVLDVEMPVMDGLQTLAAIRRDFPDVAVVMASTQTQAGAETTVKALAMGAAACVAKPRAPSVDESLRQLSRELVPLVRELGRARSSSSGEYAEPSAIGTADRETTRRSAPKRDRFQAARRSARPRRSPLLAPEIVVVGASTGGPAALTTVLKALPSPFPLPILIVQHMPPMFIPLLAKHLSHDCGHDCCEVQGGEPIESGRVYIARGGHHLLVAPRGEGKSEGPAGNGSEGKPNSHPLLVADASPLQGPLAPRFKLVVDSSEAEHFCRPSVNPLFRSAAACYGAAVLAVMLTGMGEDGIEGTREVVKQGGYVIAQDEASSVVWGMPAAVVRENLADEVLPLCRIPAALCRICRVEETVQT